MDSEPPENVKRLEEFLEELLKPKLLDAIAQRDKVFEKQKIFWIINYHEHETMLQENEDEKLSKEEQDLAWEVYQKTLEWEEVRRVSPDENTPENQKISVEESAQDQEQEPVMDEKPDPPPVPAPKRDDKFERAKQRHAYIYGQRRRRCMNLGHLLVLRSQGIKAGGHAICGECARVLRWEELEPDDRCWSTRGYEIL